uniref:hypothetical protein n=1 Tax=Salmonella enterica TaxID=28901 RepID=UPI003A93CD49
MSFENIYTLRRKESASFRNWSDSELKLLCSLTEQKLPVKKIASILNRSYNAVVHMRRKLLIVSTDHFSDYESSIVRRYAGILSSSQIGAIINRPYYAVLNYANRQGISLTRYGDNNQSTVYSDEDVNFVRALHDEGISFSDILSKFDMPRSRLCSFLYTDIRKVAADYYLLRAF